MVDISVFYTIHTETVTGKKRARTLFQRRNRIRQQRNMEEELCHET